MKYYMAYINNHDQLASFPSCSINHSCLRVAEKQNTTVLGRSCGIVSQKYTGWDCCFMLFPYHLSTPILLWMTTQLGNVKNKSMSQAEILKWRAKPWESPNSGHFKTETSDESMFCQRSKRPKRREALIPSPLPRWLFLSTPQEPPD